MMKSNEWKKTLNHSLFPPKMSPKEAKINAQKPENSQIFQNGQGWKCKMPGQGAGLANLKKIKKAFI